MKIKCKKGIVFNIENNKIYVSTGDIYIYKEGVLQGNFLRVPARDMDDAIAFLINYYKSKR